jgi:hypothetical protein
VRAKEFILEVHEKFHDEQLGPLPGMKRYDGLDNSNPYAMWRFMVAAAGQGGDDSQEPFPALGPIGQKMSTLAYSKADQEILDKTAKVMGEVGTVISTSDSTEPTSIHKVSPVKGFVGYKRK